MVRIWKLGSVEGLIEGDNEGISLLSCMIFFCCV